MKNISDLTLSGTYSCKIESDNIKYLDNKYLDFMDSQQKVDVVSESTFDFSEPSPPERPYYSTTISLDNAIPLDKNYTIIWDGKKCYKQ